jgi:hypothetical protein
MKCPKCKEEISWVVVVSQCIQHGELEGNKIKSYGTVEEIEDTIEIDCSMCGKNITKFVKEE